MIDVQFQKLINRHLGEFFKQKQKLTIGFDSRINQLIKQIAKITLSGGKRIRPYLAYLGFLGRGGKSAKQIMPVLLALELTHTYFLIHDDIMDQADIRRGVPTISAYFTQNLRKRSLALSLAILAGDLCNQWAQELFDQLSDPRLRKDDNILKARKIFNQMREEVIFGQTMDVWGMKGQNINKLLQMYDLKTGSYSIEKPLLIGAVLAGANQTQIKALSIYGQKLGLAFQLKDDLLGLFGKQEQIGKAVNQDIVEGKWTILVAKTWDKLPLSDRNTLIKILGNRKSTSAQINWVKQQMVKTQAKFEVEELMQNLVEQAKGALKPVNLRTKAELVQLAEFIRNRQT